MNPTRAASFADAHRVARGILGQDPAPSVAGRWLEAVDRVGLPLERGRDRRLWNLARRGSPWLGLVDGGLALLDPHSPVRQRLYLMLAVLETTPEHARRFEPRASIAPVAVVRLAARGALGAARAATGVPVVVFGWAFGR